MSWPMPSNFMQRFLGRSPSPDQAPSDTYQQLVSRLEAIETTLATLANRPLGPSPDPDGQSDGRLDERLDAVQQGLAAVEKQLQRAGREQLKANALVEAHQEQARGALESLEAANVRREDELAAARQQLVAAQGSARLEVVRQLLPALDGIDEALRAGAEVLGQPPATPQPTLFERMRARMPAPTAAELHMRSALRSWLHGLTFVRQRLLDVLATERIRPIEALYQPFDPNLHIALHTVDATDDAPPGTVTAVLRSGYTVGERVLRHAEVAVAQAGEPQGDLEIK